MRVGLAWLRRVAIVGVVATVLAACGGGGSGPGGAKQTVTIGMSYLGLQWDPARTVNQGADSTYISQVYDRLLQLDEKGALQPMLATAWAFSENGTLLTLTLRDDVKFQDGSVFDSGVAVRNLERVRDKDRSNLAAQLANVVSVTAAGPSTVEVRLRTPQPTLLYVLASITGSMVSPKGLDDVGALARDPAGSGAYDLVSMTSDTITFTRNPDYWESSVAPVERKIMRSIPDNQARLNAFRTGQVDAIALRLDMVAEAEQLVAAGKGEIATYPGGFTYVLYLNLKVAPLDDPQVRRAISLAIDRRVIDESLLGGNCPPSGAVAPAGLPGHVAEYDAGYPFDPEQAARILAEKGVQNATLEAIVPNAEPSVTIAAALQAQLAKVGINVNFTRVDVNLARALWREGRYAAMFNQITASSPDLTSVMDQTFLGADSPGGKPAQLVDLVDRARPLPLNSPERDQALQVVDRYLWDNPTHAMICQAPTKYLHVAGLSGIDRMPYAIFGDTPDSRAVTWGS